MSIFSLLHSLTQIIPIIPFQPVSLNLEVCATSSLATRTTHHQPQLLSSLIVCNLLVVVTYAYRVLQSSNPTSLYGSEGDTKDDDFTTPVVAPTGVQSLTTVDLSMPINETCESTGS